MRVMFPVPALLFALTALLPLQASANDWSACKGGAHAARVAACSRIIAKGQQDKAALANAYRNRASAYSRGKDKPKAVEDLNRAMNLDPAHAAHYRGLIHLNGGNFDRAIAELGEATAADPRNASIYNSRGIAHGAKGDQNLAIADFSEAIRLEPGLAAALVNRSLAYRLKGELDLAIADANKAIETAPEYSLAYMARGQAYGKKGDLDAAVAECGKAIELDPGSAEGYDCRGFAYFSKREFDKAIEDETKAVGLNPQSANAYNNRGIAHAAKRETEQALADFNKAIELNPRFAFAFANRALIYRAKHQFEQAIASLDKAIELDPQYTVAYYNRGRAYEIRKDADRALADYRKVLDLPAVTVTDKQRQELVRNRIARLAQAPRGALEPAAEAREEARPLAAPGRDEAPKPAPALASKAPGTTRAALVIGNSAYTHAGQLSNPKNDAAGVAASLRRLGFEVAELYDLDRASMGQALKRFGDMAENAEWAVVFFAGHGLELNGVSYIVPTDAELLRDTHVTDEAISLTQVQAKVDAASKLGLVILDSCRNNPFLAQMARSAGGARAIGRGLANVEPEGNVLVAYSAKHGTTALDGAGTHSPFTEALLNHIEEPGLEINFLFRKVRDEVRTKTQRQQEPFLYGSLSAELLFFKAMQGQ